MSITTIKHDITTANAEFNTPREVTDFINDAVGIDPAGCGCTDCIIGNSIPFDEAHSQKIAILAFQVRCQGRQFVSRVGTGTEIVPFQHDFDFGFTLHIN